MRYNTHIHRCNTDNPTRPCCWTKRRAKFDSLAMADAARRAKYGALSCSQCGRVYAVDMSTMTVEDHESCCQPLTDAQKWG